jgi:hypothetical protein
MSIKSRVLAIAAVSALTAATAVPAMALENEFHGMMAVRGYNSNYLAGTAGRLNIDADTTTSRSWVEQRARLFYTAKANDNLKLVTGFELDSYWGKDSYDSLATRRNSGGALGSDSVNIETKWVYLDFNCPITGANFKVGMQGLNDSYKGLIVGAGADAAGIQISKAFGPATTTVGWFRLDDRNTATANAGKVTRDLWMLDGKVNVTKDIKVGGSYYVLNNDNVASAGIPPLSTGVANVPVDSIVHILGVNAAANLGPVAIDGLGLYEFGNAAAGGGSTHINAFAAAVGAKVKAGPAAVKVNGLYVSGNNSKSFGGNAFVSANNTTSTVTSENGLSAMGGVYLLIRNPKETTNEQAIIAESSNQNQGIIGGSVGVDVAVGKVFANTNVGMAFTAKKADNRNTFMGTEINAEVGYKMYDNLSASIRGAGVFLGDYYNNSSTLHVGTDPSNPYEAQLVLAYTF